MYTHLTQLTTHHTHHTDHTYHGQITTHTHYTLTTLTTHPPCGCTSQPRRPSCHGHSKPRPVGVGDEPLFLFHPHHQTQTSPTVHRHMQTQKRDGTNNTQTISSIQKSCTQATWHRDEARPGSRLASSPDQISHTPCQPGQKMGSRQAKNWDLILFFVCCTNGIYHCY